jgi:hypothetical protein
MHWCSCNVLFCTVSTVFIARETYKLLRWIYKFSWNLGLHQVFNGIFVFKFECSMWNTRTWTQIFRCVQVRVFHVDSTVTLWLGWEFPLQIQCIYCIEADLTEGFHYGLRSQVVLKVDLTERLYWALKVFTMGSEVRLCRRWMKLTDFIEHWGFSLWAQKPGCVEGGWKWHILLSIEGFQYGLRSQVVLKVDLTDRLYWALKVFHYGLRIRLCWRWMKMTDFIGHWGFSLWA